MSEQNDNKALEEKAARRRAGSLASHRVCHKNIILAVAKKALNTQPALNDRTLFRTLKSYLHTHRLDQRLRQA